MPEREIVVLRYGHRVVRDARVTSHCCLVARALGAGKIVVEGIADSGLEKSVQEIVQNWGGRFELEFTGDWKKEVLKYRKRGFKVVHLTMYGIPAGEKIKAIRKQPKLLVVIGSQKVAREVYGLADYNVSITLQPHSEIGALAVFLYMLEGNKSLTQKFGDAHIEVQPSEHDKKTVNPSS